jgi:hypothetical protein
MREKLGEDPKVFGRVRVNKIRIWRVSESEHEICYYFWYVNYVNGKNEIC